MRKLDVVRAWKDEDYRSSLSERHRAAMPENPAGAADLSENDLDKVAGAAAAGTWNVFCGSLLFDCPTGDFVPCPSQLFMCSFDFSCPITFGPICPIAE